MTYDFSGKVAVVTGGARNIGLATVKAFAESNGRVALVDRDEVSARDSVDRLGFPVGQVKPFAADVSDETSVKDLMQRLEKAFGGLDVIVNNAGNLHAELGARPQRRGMGQRAWRQPPRAMALRQAWRSVDEERRRRRKRGLAGCATCPKVHCPLQCFENGDYRPYPRSSRRTCSEDSSECGQSRHDPN